jgi:hypothetical protein
MALTVTLINVGEVEPARALGEDTLQTCRRVHSPDHARTLWAAAALTLARVALGEAEEARALGEDTLQRCRRALNPPDHLITLWAAAALTVARASVGEAEPARSLGQDTLQGCRRALGRDNPIALYLTQVAGNGRLLLADDVAVDRPSRSL